MVEESETTLESPSGTQSETREVVEGVNSPSPSASPGYSNIFSFLADDVVYKFLQGAGTGILIDFYLHLSSNNLLSSHIFTSQILYHHFHFFSC